MATVADAPDVLNEADPNEADPNGAALMARHPGAPGLRGLVADPSPGAPPTPNPRPGSPVGRPSRRVWKPNS